MSAPKALKAVIPVAGWGTRRLPITKTIEKCMLPVGNRPIIDYVVEDCVKAGIREIIFVVSQSAEQIRSYYTRNTRLEEYLTMHGKADLLPTVTPPHDLSFHFVVQPQAGAYGTTIPVALAAQAHDLSEGAVVLMGDDFIYHSTSDSEVARLVKAAGIGSSLLGVQVPRELVSRYGVLDVSVEGDFRQIVEKPTIEAAPSNLINVSKYYMNGELIKYVQQHAADKSVVGEYQITEAVNRYVAAGNRLKVLEAKGEYLDGGTLEGWLYANEVVCKDLL